MKKANILYDAAPIVDNKKTGVGYFVYSLISSLNEYHSNQLDLTGYYFNFLNRHGDKVGNLRNFNFYKIKFIPGKVLSLFRKFGYQPFLEFFVHKKADYVIYTNYVSLPQIKRRKTALIIYDLGFLDAPEFMQDKNQIFLNKFCPVSIKSADIIITISNFTKSRIVSYFPEVQNKIIITPVPPLKITHKHIPLSSGLLIKGVIENKYVLAVGTLEPRKNLINLVNAYSLLDEDIVKDYSLVIAGGKGWKDEKIIETIRNAQKSGLNVIDTGYVTNEELNELYANAKCFVMPSHYEGFGMPLLEAMQHDIPTLASDIEVFREICGDASLFFNKDSPEDIAEKVKKILLDDSLSKSLVLNGSKQLKKFNWEKNANTVYNALVSPSK